MSYTSYTITTYHCPNCNGEISSFVPKSTIWAVYCKKCGTSVKVPSSFYKDTWWLFLFVVLFIPLCFIGYFHIEPPSLLGSFVFGLFINALFSKFLAWLIVDVFVYW